MTTLPGRLLLYISLFLFTSLILPSFFLSSNSLLLFISTMSHVLSSSLFQHLMGVERKKIDLENCRFAFFFSKIQIESRRQWRKNRDSLEIKTLFKGRMSLVVLFILLYYSSFNINYLISSTFIFLAEKI